MTIQFRNVLFLRRLISVKSNHRSCSNITSNLQKSQTEFNPIEEKWNPEIVKNLQDSFKIIPDFISEEEEMALLKEVEPHLIRLVYEKNHWDEAIIDFRETERKNWNKVNSEVIQRLRQNGFKADVKHLPHVHVLDLAEDGHIKPHIDSPRYCGDTVAVLSLLSDCILKLVNAQMKDYSVKYLVPRRSLYVMSGPSRYDYTHEILANDISLTNVFPSTINETKVRKSRRISVVCRNDP